MGTSEFIALCAQAGDDALAVDQGLRTAERDEAHPRYARRVACGMSVVHGEGLPERASEGASGVGPPGEIPGGFSFWRLGPTRTASLAPGKAAARTSPLAGKMGHRGICIRLQMNPADTSRD